MSNDIPQNLYPYYIGEAMFNWLNYVRITSNSNILQEASIRYPLAEVVERRIGKTVKLEYSHPYFSSRRIDFVFSKKEENLVEKEGYIGENRIYIELKYASDRNKDKQEKQRVFNDLMRLALVSKEVSNDCYFIFCGNTEDFKSYVLEEIDGGKLLNGNVISIPTDTIDNSESSVRISKDSVYKNWLSFDDSLPVHEVNMMNCRKPLDLQDENQCEFNNTIFFNEFKKDYCKTEKAKDYFEKHCISRFYTELVFENENSQGLSVYIWKISIDNQQIIRKTTN